MEKMMLVQRAACERRICGWIGDAWQRVARASGTEPLFCPQCGGSTKSWIVDQQAEQQSLDRLQAERAQAAQVPLDAYRRSREAHARWRAAEQQVKRCRAELSLAEVNEPSDERRQFQLKQRFLKAQREAAEAALARDQAVAQVSALR